MAPVVHHPSMDSTARSAGSERAANSGNPPTRSFGPDATTVVRRVAAIVAISRRRDASDRRPSESPTTVIVTHGFLADAFTLKVG